MSDGFPSDWTERPHWVVVARERGGEPTCIGHHPTRALADEQAHRKRVAVAAEGTRVWVARTGQVAA